MRLVHLDTPDYLIYSTAENDRRLPQLILEEKATGARKIGHAYSAQQAEFIWDIFIADIGGMEMPEKEYWLRVRKVVEPEEQKILAVFRTLPRVA